MQKNQAKRNPNKDWHIESNHKQRRDWQMVDVMELE